MQAFLKTLQHELGMTFLYVTHDQEEALTMSTNVAVFNEGRIEQIGTPVEIYERPATEFVADFVGTSNILDRDGRRVVVRPERIAFASDGDGEPATISDVVFVGAFTRYVAVTNRGEQLIVIRPSDGSTLERGAQVRLAWRDEDTFRLPESQSEPREDT